MDWAGVDMVHLSLTLSFLLRLLPTTSTERYHIRSATDGAPPSVFKDISTSDRLSAFVPVTTDIVCTMVRDATNKYSINDPMPTWLLKTCIDLLAPYAVQHVAVIWHCSTCRCHLALFRRITKVRIPFLALRSRLFLVEILRVIDRYLICRFFPSYLSGSSACSLRNICHRQDFFPCISQPIESSIRRRLRFSRCDRPH